MQNIDDFLDMPKNPAEAAAIEGSPWAVLNQADEIGETELFAAATHIYAHLVSVPRSFQEQNLLELTFKELGYLNATHGYQVGAVDAAFNIRDAIQKRLKKEAEKELETGQQK